MKDLKELKGVKVLNKNEQKAIKGGVAACGDGHQCPLGWSCPVDYHTPGTYSCRRGIEL